MPRAGIAHRHGFVAGIFACGLMWPAPAPIAVMRGTGACPAAPGTAPKPEGARAPCLTLPWKPEPPPTPGVLRETRRARRRRSSAGHARRPRSSPPACETAPARSSATASGTAPASPSRPASSSARSTGSSPSGSRSADRCAGRRRAAPIWRSRPGRACWRGPCGSRGAGLARPAPCPPAPAIGAAGWRRRAVPCRAAAGSDEDHAVQTKTTPSAARGVSLAVISSEKAKPATTSARESAPASKPRVQWAIPSASPARSRALR